LLSVELLPQPDFSTSDDAEGRPASACRC